MLTTFLRDATYTSQVNGIASIDQRLVKFSLRPGTEDPGTSQNWGVPSYIPAGKRTGLLATFNGGFKLDSAGGGFYGDHQLARAARGSAVGRHCAGSLQYAHRTGSAPSGRRPVGRRRWRRRGFARWKRRPRNRR